MAGRDERDEQDDGQTHDGTPGERALIRLVAGELASALRRVVLDLHIAGIEAASAAAVRAYATGFADGGEQEALLAETDVAIEDDDRRDFAAIVPAGDDAVPEVVRRAENRIGPGTKIGPGEGMGELWVLQVWLAFRTALIARGWSLAGLDREGDGSYVMICQPYGAAPGIAQVTGRADTLTDLYGDIELMDDISTDGGE